MSDNALERGIYAAVTPATMAELSYEFERSQGAKHAILNGWKDVFKEVRNASLVVDPGEITFRDRYARETKYDSSRGRRSLGDELASKFVSAMYAIAYGNRSGENIGLAKGRGTVPNDLTQYSPEQRSRLETATLVYKAGSRYLRTRVEISKDKIIVREGGDQVLEVLNEKGVAVFVVRVDSATSSQRRIRVEASRSFYLIRDGFVFSDTHPTGASLHVQPDEPDNEDL